MIKTLIGAVLLSWTAAATPAAGAAGLIELYEIARQQDPQLQAALANRNATLENEPIVRSGLLPNLSGSGTLNYNDDDIVESGAFGRSDDRYGSATAGVQVTQAVYRRALLKQLDQAQLQGRQAQAELEQVEQDLMLRVAEAYFGVLAAQDDLKFARAQLEAIERQLDQAKQQFEVGLIAITGVHEAQARFDQGRADEISAINALDNAWERLREIVGVTPESLADLRQGLPLDFPTPTEMEAWTEIAMERNPRVEAALLGTEIARKEIEVQRSGHYPTLDAVGSYQVSRTDADFGTDQNSAQVGLQLAVPIYLGGGVQAATRQAQFQFQAAQEVLDEARRSVTRQVRDAFRGIESSISRVEALDTTTVSAQSALDATEAGYEVGTRTLVDVLNSQSTLFSAQRDFANSRYEYILNKLRLQRAAGVLERDDLKEVSQQLLQP